MRKATLLAATATLILTIGANANATAHAEPTWDCNSQSHTKCVNTGSSAHGYEQYCYAPSNVIVAFAYYGHVFGAFDGPFKSMEHFYYGGAPFWTVAYFDHNDSESGFMVPWRMGGPKQDYPGQRHLIYEVNAYCEPQDGPKQRMGRPGPEDAPPLEPSWQLA